jgi:hypothetical protein
MAMNRTVAKRTGGLRSFLQGGYTRTVFLRLHFAALFLVPLQQELWALAVVLAAVAGPGLPVVRPLPEGAGHHTAHRTLYRLVQVRHISDRFSAQALLLRIPHRIYFLQVPEPCTGGRNLSDCLVDRSLISPNHCIRDPFFL